MKRYVVEQLGFVYRENAPDPVVVVAPTRRTGTNIGRWLAAAGTSFVNVRFETIESLARLYAESHGAPMLRIAERDIRLLAVAEAIDRCAGDDNFYFGSGTGPGFARSVELTISALRNSRVDQATLARGSSSRVRSVARLLAEYGEVLRRERLMDTAELLETAAAVSASDDGTLDVGALCILDDVHVSAVAEEFLCGLRAAARFRIGAPHYVHDPSARSAATRFASWPIPGGPPSIEAEVCGISLAEAASPGRRVEIATADSPEREVEGVLSEILSTGLPFDECELAYSTTDYESAIDSVAQSLGVPCTFAAGRPSATTKPGRAVLAFYKWIQRGLDPEDLEALLRLRCIRFETQEGRPAVSASRLAEHVREHAAGRGVSAYDRALRPPPADHPAPDRYLARTAVLHQFLKLVQFGTTSTVGDLARSGVLLLDEHVSALPNDAALHSIREHLVRLSESELDMPIAQAAAFLRELLSENKFETAGAEPGSVYVVPLDRAGYAGRSCTFMVGLDEHVFPGPSHEDPVLLDDDRASISDSMPLRRGDAGGRVWALERALLCAGDQITLVGRRLDLIYGKQIALTPTLLTLASRLGIEMTAWPLVESADRALTDSTALLSQRDTSGFVSAVEDAYPWMHTGHAAGLRRFAPALDEYTGFIGRATPELSLRDGTVVSPTRMEHLAQCPYRYFLRYVLRIRKPDDHEAAFGRWLNPLQFGSALHEVYHRFMETVTRRDERPDEHEHGDEILATVDEIISAEAERNPPPNAASREADRERMRRSAMIFLRRESRSTARPFAFEYAFGDDERKVADVRLTGELALRLSGRIDRVDRRGDGFEIWDYKTGQMRPAADVGMLDTFEYLQWVLYAYAFEALRSQEEPGARVLRSGYLFVSDREKARFRAEPPPDRRLFGEAIKPLVEMVEAGAFPHFQKAKGAEGACGFCDYNEICAAERRELKHLDELSGQALESGSGALLQAWMRGGML